MSILGKNDLPLDFKWIGTLNSSGNAEFTGKKALNHAKALFSANPQLSKQKIILLYDSDTNKPPENDALLYVRTMPIQEKNITYKIGIENLLSLPSSFDKDNFYKERKKTDHYGAVSTICELDKTKLCGHICNDISPEQQKEYFMVFESVFDELNAVVNS